MSKCAFRAPLLIVEGRTTMPTKKTGTPIDDLNKHREACRDAKLAFRDQCAVSANVIEGGLWEALNCGAKAFVDVKGRLARDGSVYQGTVKLAHTLVPDCPRITFEIRPTASGPVLLVGSASHPAPRDEDDLRRVVGSFVQAFRAAISESFGL
jgi:hypothetical protein